MGTLLALLAGLASILLFLFLTVEFPSESGPFILTVLLTYIVIAYVVLWRRRYAKQDD